MASTRTGITFWTSLLIAANLSADAAAFAYNGPQPWWVSGVITSLFATQTCILGTWAALGDGRWYWRLLLSAALALCMASAIDLGLAWAGMIQYLSREQSASTRGTFLAELLMVFLAVIPLRRFCNWRLTWQEGIGVSDKRQLSVSDIMIWMVPFGVVLALYRFAGTKAEWTTTNVLRHLLVLCGQLAITLTAMLSAFATQHKHRASVLAIGVSVLVGLLTALMDTVTLDAETFARIVPSRYAGKPLLQFLWVALEASTAYILISCAAALVVWANFRALRALGCRLIIPSQHSQR